MSIRALYDTNVIVSGILSKGTPRSLMDAAIRGDVDLVSSPHLLRELEELLARKFGFSEASAATIRQEMEQLAEVVVPEQVPRVCRDPDDDQVLAMGLAGGVGYIVTGDGDLLVLDSFEGIQIVQPAAFAAELATDL